MTNANIVEYSVDDGAPDFEDLCGPQPQAQQEGELPRPIWEEEWLPLRSRDARIHLVVHVCLDLSPSDTAFGGFGWYLPGIGLRRTTAWDTGLVSHAQANVLMVLQALSYLSDVGLTSTERPFRIILEDRMAIQSIENTKGKAVCTRLGRPSSRVRSLIEQFAATTELVHCRWEDRARAWKVSFKWPGSPD